ncbi:MAG: hypothetical protein Q4F66_09535 [Clostridium sp.]|nr:hypothetical protein [Clostridium sp.]
MTKDIREEFEMFEKGLCYDVEEDKGIMEYNKYMVLTNKGTSSEQVYGVYDVEIDALRRLKEEKAKKTRNISIIKADIKYVYLAGVKFIKEYKELI